ncbi:hypothetical protein [Muricoccus vinaceus]|uniref:Uncharacterized protein n=1 Tax=Muricoccus vinaceus TaxID=424704 RepID=A0ABV6IYI6_9PROT
MSHDFIDDRRKALEEAFFARQNAELIRRLHAPEGQKELSGSTGIQDPKVLERLEAHGIGANALAALSLAPLVLVAWADGTPEPEERRAILSAAGEAGIPTGGAAHALLDHWLAQHPPQDLLATWTDYVHALAPEARAALHKDVIARAHQVAEASGGFLGLTSKVSPTEKAMLKRLEDAFTA